ncbi:MAG: ISKra4 family transposase [Chloroflexota bacterium]|nr:ISKra4 family transposase [Chloroflexota bacterium]
MEPVPSVGWGFFPLDEQLALLAGSLTPTQEEYLVRVATWMPFGCAGRMLEALLGVQVSEATVRRHTYQAGQVYEEGQNTHRQCPSTSKLPGSRTSEQLVLSADGAMVPLVGGVWAEVRTLAIGEVKHEGEQTRTSALSYFSRMTDALTFTDLAEGEMERRRVPEAPQVAAVMDGADWLQGLVDGHRPDAVRILDFPHAAQRISAILDTVQHAGHPLPLDALPRCLHLLKHRGPSPVLRWLRHLTRSVVERGTIREDLAYLHKREASMQYPRYRQAGWPMGSGMVESANKLVMQTRMKGPGMHWAGPHVNPMLALRNAVCNDRWSEAWELTGSTRLVQRQHTRLTAVHHRQHEATHRFLLLWMRFLLPSLRGCPPPPAPPRPACMADGKPTAHHPWRRRWSPRSPTAEPAKK